MRVAGASWVAPAPGRVGERVAEALGVPAGLGVRVCVAVAVAVAVTVTEPVGGWGSALLLPVGAGSSPVAYTRPVAARLAAATSTRETRGEGWRARRFSSRSSGPGRRRRRDVGGGAGGAGAVAGSAGADRAAR